MKKSSKDLGISQKISLIRAHFGLSAEALGAKAGVSGTAIANVERGESLNPGAEMLANISSILGVNLNWLLLGEGEMLKSDENSTGAENKFSYIPAENHLTVVREEKQAPYSNAGDGLRILTVQVGADNEENIELVESRAAAGYARGGFMEREFIGNLPHFRLPDKAYRNGSFRCFQVSGESMQSTLYNGDWVICRFVDQWDRDIRDNRVYVVVTEEGIRVKRLLNRLTDRGQLTLQSDNTAYPLDFIDGADVREVWEGVGKLSRQFVNPRYDINLELARHNEAIGELMLRLDKAGL